MAQKADTEPLSDGVAEPTKDAIRGNFIYLIEELDANGILDYLYQEHVLENDDVQRIRSEPTDSTKNRVLLDIVLHKKTHKQFLTFLQALHTCGSQEHIWKQLMEYKKSDHDRSVSATIKDPETLQCFLRTCAADRLESTKGSTILLREIETYFSHQLKESGLDRYHHLTTEHVIDAVKSQFPQSNFQKWENTPKKRGSKKKSSTINAESSFTDLKLRKKHTHDAEPSTIKIGAGNGTGSDDEMDPKQLLRTQTKSQGCSLKRWDIQQVSEFLSKLEIDATIIETFRDQDISGDVFEEMTRQEMKEICPNAKFGHLKKIINARTEFLEGKHTSTSTIPTSKIDKRQMETRRKFDKEVSPSTKYKQEAFLPEANKHTGNPLEPVAIYHLLPEADHMIPQFQKSAMEFICACMNERTNGTIYFGVKESGEIVGHPGSQGEWNTALQEGINSFFYPDQRDHVRKSIRPLRLIEVLRPHDSGEDTKYVIELDVVPSHAICEESAYFIKKGKIQKSKDGSPFVQFGEAHLLRYENGSLVPVSGEKLAKFMYIKSQLSKNRQQKEEEQRNKASTSYQDLGQKLKHLLCRGEETMDGDIFPILVTSGLPLEYTDNDKVENFQFLKDLPWKAVFDFDDGGALYTYLEEEEEQVLKVITVEDFDQNSTENNGNSERLQNLLQDLKTSSHRPWIFTNGYECLDQVPMTVVKWKQTRSKGFKEAVRFMENEIPKGRAVVVFMLFSKDYEVMLEAADELAQKFGNQWFTVADSSEVSDRWQEGLCQRHLVEDRKDLDERSVIGIPWNHVNDTIKSILGRVKEGACELPTSNGSLVKLSDRMKNDWIDLEIVSAKQCKNETICSDVDKMQQHATHIEAQFYKGGEVDWWNFYFSHHVLERSCLKTLQKCVHDTLRGQNAEEDRVACIHLYHQPGAGGTTTAKQILWNLKEEYRCAIVKKITTQTSDQITKLHVYEDERQPKPVLLLFDNLDDERTSELRADLEAKAKQISRQNLDNPCPVFYVFLICTRNTILPNPKAGSKYSLLKHELKANEQQWFRDKYFELKKKFEQNAKSGVNPKHLISFNIMKENFDTEYIERTVRDLLSELKDKNEKTLLKYVSLLNAYDISFQSLPASAFNCIMEEQNMRWVSRGRWELHLSQPTTILLNQVNRKKLGEGQHIRIIHNTLSEKIFNELRSTAEGTDIKLTLSDEVIEFLDSGIFSSVYPDNSVEQLMKVVKDVVKKRARNPRNGKPVTKFAQLIETILNDAKDGVEQAARVLERVYQLSDDCFVGQQLARLFIHSSNWEQAQKYAKDITEKKQDNSYLWDTYGHSYREQKRKKYRLDLR